MQTVDIYIDTSIKGPKRRHGTYLYIIAAQTSKGPADVWKMDSLPDTTENQATLKALEAALKRIKKPCHMVIHLECIYVAGALQNQLYIGWKNNGWMTARNKQVCDAETWQSIECLLNVHEFEVVLKEPHTYREWMQRTLNDKESLENAGSKK